MPEQASTATEPVKPPAVTGVRVWTSAFADRQHPAGRHAWSNADRELAVEDEHGRTIATYAVGAWLSFELLVEQAAEVPA